MKSLVTGGFGFIGSHLVDTLLREPGRHVHVVDNLSSSPLPQDYLLKEIGPNPRLTYSITSVQDFCADPQVRLDFDEVYHLASVVGPAGVLPHAGQIIRKTVDDTYSLMGLVTKAGARLVDVSTSEVYGGGQEGYCSEEMSMIVTPRYSARLEYAAAKLASEIALINTANTGKLDVVIIRPFNVSGPRQSGKGGFVLPRFVAAALDGRPLTVFGDGSQIRAFTHVQDIVDGIILAMRKGAKGRIYNLGNPNNRCTINELADSVIACTGGRARKVYIDPKTLYGPLFEEANNKFPDSRRAQKELGWNPLHGRDEIVRQTVEYFKALPVDVRAHLAGKIA